MAEETKVASPLERAQELVEAREEVEALAPKVEQRPVLKKAPVRRERRVSSRVALLLENEDTRRLFINAHSQYPNLGAKQFLSHAMESFERLSRLSDERGREAPVWQVLTVKDISEARDALGLTKKKVEVVTQEMEPTKRGGKGRGELQEFLRIQKVLRAEDCTFIDEFSVSLVNKPTKGWATKGERARIVMPYMEHAKTHVVIAMAYPREDSNAASRALYRREPFVFFRVYPPITSAGFYHYVWQLNSALDEARLVAAREGWQGISWADVRARIRDELVREWAEGVGVSDDAAATTEQARVKALRQMQFTVPAGCHTREGGWKLDRWTPIYKRVDFRTPVDAERWEEAGIRSADQVHRFLAEHNNMLSESGLPLDHHVYRYEDDARGRSGEAGSIVAEDDPLVEDTFSMAEEKKKQATIRSLEKAVNSSPLHQVKRLRLCRAVVVLVRLMRANGVTSPELWGRRAVELALEMQEKRWNEADAYEGDQYAAMANLGDVSRWAMLLGREFVAGDLKRLLTLWKARVQGDQAVKLQYVFRVLLGLRRLDSPAFPGFDVDAVQGDGLTPVSPPEWSYEVATASGADVSPVGSVPIKVTVGEGAFFAYTPRVEDVQNFYWHHLPLSMVEGRVQVMDGASVHLRDTYRDRFREGYLSFGPLTDEQAAAYEDSPYTGNFEGIGGRLYTGADRYPMENRMVETLTKVPQKRFRGYNVELWATPSQVRKALAGSGARLRCCVPDCPRPDFASHVRHRGELNHSFKINEAEEAFKLVRAHREREFKAAMLSTPGQLAVVYTPAYRPQFNPIERLIGRIKSQLKQENFWTYSANPLVLRRNLTRALHRLLRCTTVAAARNYIECSGYLSRSAYRACLAYANTHAGQSPPWVPGGFLYPGQWKWAKRWNRETRRYEDEGLEDYDARYKAELKRMVRALHGGIDLTETDTDKGASRYQCFGTVRFHGFPDFIPMAHVERVMKEREWTLGRVFALVQAGSLQGLELFNPRLPLAPRVEDPRVYRLTEAGVAALKELGGGMKKYRRLSARDQFVFVREHGVVGYANLLRLADAATFPHDREAKPSLISLKILGADEPLRCPDPGAPLPPPADAGEAAREVAARDRLFDAVPGSSQFERMRTWLKSGPVNALLRAAARPRGAEAKPYLRRAGEAMDSRKGAALLEQLRGSRVRRYLRDVDTADELREALLSGELSPAVVDYLLSLGSFAEMAGAPLWMEGQVDAEYLAKARDALEPYWTRDVGSRGFKTMVQTGSAMAFNRSWGLVWGGGYAPLGTGARSTRA